VITTVLKLGRDQVAWVLMLRRALPVLERPLIAGSPLGDACYGTLVRSRPEACKEG
jgi:hypothetical protein